MDDLTLKFIEEIKEYARLCLTSEISEEEKIKLKDHIAKSLSLPNVSDLFSLAENKALKELVES